jgi:hypothetical protein
MQSFFIDIVVNLSIAIAAIIAMVRFKLVTREYYPFLFLLWLGLFNELLSLVFIYTIRTNTVNSNVYVLLEYGLILLQFFYWNDDKRQKYYLLALLGLAVWTADNFFINSITRNNSLFRVFYSFVIILFSINQINKILIYERDPVLKNAMFLICITFLFYYGCKAFMESFNMLHLGFSSNLLENLWIILYFVNVITNLLYALAVLCIPTRTKFSLPY